MDYVTAGVLTGMPCLILSYAALLEAFHDRYIPDHVWIAVAGGCALIVLVFWVWLWLDPLPPHHQFAACWRLAALTWTAACPIIGWQLGQSRSRRDIRRRDAERRCNDERK